MKTAVILFGRNDGYKEKERFIIHITTMLETFDEVIYIDFGYKLNSTFSKNFCMRMLKSVIMAFLGRANIGDTLVFTAIKI